MFGLFQRTIGDTIKLLLEIDNAPREMYGIYIRNEQITNINVLKDLVQNIALQVIPGLPDELLNKIASKYYDIKEDALLEDFVILNKQHIPTINYKIYTQPAKYNLEGKKQIIKTIRSIYQD